MAYKVIWRLQQNAGRRVGGWGFNMWSNAGDLGSCITATNALRNRIWDITGVGCKVPTARISVVGQQRQVTPLEYSAATGTGSDDDLQADYPSTALLLRMTAAQPSGPGGFAEVRSWMRGIPDGLVRTGGVYSPGGTPGWIPKFQAFQAEITTASRGWSLRVLDQSQAKKVVSAVNLTTGVLTVTGHGYTSPDGIVSLRISGYIYPSGLNRIWQVKILTADTLQLLYYSPPPEGTPVVAKKASVRLQTYLYLAINGVSVLRATSHYTGRPTDLLGGRRRKKRSTSAGAPVVA